MRHLNDVSIGIRLLDRAQVERAIFVLREARERGSTVWLVGNGGSAANASHFSNDLNKACGIKAFSLPDMVSLVSAHMNDDGVENMFSNPLRKLSKGGDVLVAISCSGNSMNVVQATKYMMEVGSVIAMTGCNPSKLSLLRPDVLIQAMIEDIKAQEDIHSIACHTITRGLL